MHYQIISERRDRYSYDSEVLNSYAEGAPYSTKSIIENGLYIFQSA